MWNPISSFSDLLGFSGGRKTSARNGWKTAAVWYGLNRISGNVGTLDLDLKKKDNAGNTETVTIGLGPNLMRRPSPIYGPLTFKQTMTAQALWHGNGRAYIHRDGRQSEMIILDPNSTTTGMVEGEKMHATFINTAGNTPENRMQLFERMENNPSKTVIIRDADCFHIQGFGDGVQGVPLYVAAKTSLESMLGADERAEDQINRGFVAKVFLKAPEASTQFRTQEQANEFLTDFTARHGEDGARQKVGMLRGGMGIESMGSMNNNDAQFVETRKYLRQDAALWLLLESMLGDNESESYNSLTQRQLSYLINCLETWLTRWEEEADYKLLTEPQFESGNYHFKFDTTKMLRTDLETMAGTFGSLITSRVLNPNEARERIGMNPYDGGDEFINPAITQTTDEPGEEPEEPEEEEPTEIENKARKAIKSRLDVLINTEQFQVSKRLKRGDSLDSISTWYDSFCGKLGNAIESLGGSKQLAQTHCEGSLNYIKRNPEQFDLAGSSDLLTSKIMEN